MKKSTAVVFRTIGVGVLAIILAVSITYGARYFHELKRAYQTASWYAFTVAGIMAAVVLVASYKLAAYISYNQPLAFFHDEKMPDYSQTVLVIWLGGFLLSGIVFSLIIYAFCQEC